MTEQSHNHTGGQSFADQTELETMSNAGAKQEKSHASALIFEDENLVGQRVCALLNLGLSDLPEPILKRIMSSRRQALEWRNILLRES